MTKITTVQTDLKFNVEDLRSYYYKKAQKIDRNIDDIINTQVDEFYYLKHDELDKKVGKDLSDIRVLQLSKGGNMLYNIVDAYSYVDYYRENIIKPLFEKISEIKSATFLLNQDTYMEWEYCETSIQAYLYEINTNLKKLYSAIKNN